jgi:Spirocyclase AveC-like
MRSLTFPLAMLGAILLLYQIWGYVGWMLSSDFAPSPTGIDPISPSTLSNVLTAERNQVVMATVWTAWLVIELLRRRELSWPLMLSIAWATVYWQDPFVNLIDHNFSYNKFYFNRGDWASHLPFMPVSGPVLPQPLLMESLAFWWLLPAFAIFTYFTMRCAERFFRVRSRIGLLAIGWGALYLIDFLLESSAIRNQTMAWNRVDSAMALHAGTPAQWPIYEGVLVSMVWAAPGVIYFFRGSNRFSRLDEGVEAIRSPFLRVATQLLAISGAYNLLFLLNNLGLILLSGSTTASFPSWLRL